MPDGLFASLPVLVVESKTLVLVLALALGACDQSRKPAAEQNSPAPNAGALPLRLDGPTLKAISMATGDLLALKEQTIAQIPDPKLVTDFNRCFARLESYDVTVREAADRYQVEVIPVGERCLEPGETLRGGGGTYEIGKKNFAILKRDYGE